MQIAEITVLQMSMSVITGWSNFSLSSNSRKLSPSSVDCYFTLQSQPRWQHTSSRSSSARPTRS